MVILKLHTAAHLAAYMGKYNSDVCIRFAALTQNVHKL